MHMEPSSVCSSAISIISKQMESMSMTNGVLRRSKTIPPSRYSPYSSGLRKKKEKQKEEAIRLGVKLSIFVAEATFLLSDDIYSAVSFGCWLCKTVGNENYEGPVVGRLSCVFLHVFETYILPKMEARCHAGDNSKQWELITTSTQHFSFTVEALDRIVSILKNGEVVKQSGLEYYNRELKNLEEKLRSSKHVSEANGFDMKAIKATVLQMWMSLFQASPQGINPKISSNGSEKYTTMTSFTREKQKEEVVKLGVELSRFVAETMFLLSDDIRSTLYFCFWLFKFPGKLNFSGPVFGRLFRVVEYVFITHIKPKNGIYHDGGISIHCQQSKALYPNFASVLRVLDRIVTILKNGGGVKLSGFRYCNQELKKLEEKSGYSKDVSKANGFVREAIKCNIFQLWKPLFGTTPEVINPITRVLE